MNPVLRLKLSDLFRAILEERCGNEGYVGIAPDGSAYHVVVPVDRQISRGLKFWSVPEDRTPFGGYKGWHYFRCPTYSAPVEGREEERIIRQAKARQTIPLIQKWALEFQVKVEFEDDLN